MKNDYGKNPALAVGRGVLSYTTQCFPCPVSGGGVITVFSCRYAPSATGEPMVFTAWVQSGSGLKSTGSTLDWSHSRSGVYLRK